MPPLKFHSGFFTPTLDKEPFVLEKEKNFLYLIIILKKLRKARHNKDFLVKNKNLNSKILSFYKKAVPYYGISPIG